MRAWLPSSSFYSSSPPFALQVYLSRVYSSPFPLSNCQPLLHLLQFSLFFLPAPTFALWAPWPLTSWTSTSQKSNPSTWSNPIPLHGQILRSTRQLFRPKNRYTDEPLGSPPHFSIWSIIAEWGCCTHDCLSAKLLHTPPPLHGVVKVLLLCRFYFLVIVIRAWSIKKVFQKINKIKIAKS